MQNVVTGLILLSRPYFWVILPLAYLVGLSYSPNGLIHPDFHFSRIMMLQLFFLTFPFCFFTFGLNDIYDVQSDSINPRKRRKKEDSKTPEEMTFQGISKPAIYITSLFIASGMVIIALFSGNVLNLFHTVSLIVLSFTYSTPPWRLKTRPPLDSIVAGIMGCFSPVAMGYSLVDSTGFLPAQVYLLSLAAMGFHAFSTIMDETPDKAAGDSTFAIRFGKRTTVLFATSTALLLLSSIQIIYIKVFLWGAILFYLYTLLFPSERAVKIFTQIIYILFVIMALFKLGHLFGL